MDQRHRATVEVGVDRQNFAEAGDQVARHAIHRLESGPPTDVHDADDADEAIGADVLAGRLLEPEWCKDPIVYGVDRLAEGVLAQRSSIAVLD
jgi:hypothetical protein